MVGQMDHVEWDHLLTWIGLVNPMQPKMEVVGWVVGNYNTDKVKPPLQDQKFVKVDRKTHQIVDIQDNSDQ